MAEVKKVSQGAYNKSFWRWYLGATAAGNYENIQGCGFAYSMAPIAKELYPGDSEACKKVMKRHMTFYNTATHIGSVINGVSIAMEEQGAAGAMDGETVTATKAALMGPLAGIGDSLLQGIIIPIFLSLCIDLTQNGLWLAPVLYSAIIIIVQIALTKIAWDFGYKKGGESIVELVSNGQIEKIMTAAGIMGCAVMGALIARYVSVQWALPISIGGSEISIQTSFFDAIMPKLLPFLVTIGCVKALNNGKKSMTIIVILIVAGVVFGAFGILSK